MPQAFIRILERQPIHALERYKHHRELSHIRFAKLLFSADGKPIENAFVAADLEETLEHAHVQRLAEATRAREKIDLSPIPHEIRNQSCFVYVIEILFSQLLKAVNAHGQFPVLHTAPPFRGTPSMLCPYFTSYPRAYQEFPGLKIA